MKRTLSFNCYVFLSHGWRFYTRMPLYIYIDIVCKTLFVNIHLCVSVRDHPIPSLLVITFWIVCNWIHFYNVANFMIKSYSHLSVLRFLRNKLDHSVRVHEKERCVYQLQPGLLSCREHYIAYTQHFWGVRFDQAVVHEKVGWSY